MLTDLSDFEGFFVARNTKRSHPFSHSRSSGQSRCTYLVKSCVSFVVDLCCTDRECRLVQQPFFRFYSQCHCSFRFQCLSWSGLFASEWQVIWVLTGKSHAEWTRSSDNKAVDGFELHLPLPSRNLDSFCRIQLMLENVPARYTVPERLATVLGLQQETFDRMMMALWAYIKRNSLQVNDLQSLLLT